MSKNWNEPSSLPNEDVNWDRVREQHKTGTNPKQARQHEQDLARIDERTPEEAGGKKISRSHRR